MLSTVVAMVRTATAQIISPRRAWMSSIWHTTSGSLRMLGSLPKPLTESYPSVLEPVEHVVLQYDVLYPNTRATSASATGQLLGKPNKLQAKERLQIMPSCAAARSSYVHSFAIFDAIFDANWLLIV